MKLFYTLTVLLLTGSMASAQSNFKPGYIVTTQGDTLKGLVDYRDWNKNPKQVAFKSSANETTKKVTVANSKSFGVDGIEYYDKATVKISTGAVALSRLSNKIDTAFIIDTVFLKKIVTGKKLVLYLFNDDTKPHFYILNTQSNEISPLLQYLYLDDSQSNLLSIDAYKNELLRLAVIFSPADASIQKSISNTKYSEEDLARIVIKLNGEGVSKKTQTKNSGTRFFIGVDLRSSKLAFSGQSAPFADGKTANAFSPAISVGIDILPNKNTEKIYLRTELEIFQNHFKLSETNTDGSSTLDFKQTGLSFSPQIIYNFYATDKFKAFVNLGAALNFYRYNNYQFITKRNTGSVNVQDLFPDFQKFQISVPVSAGVQFNRRIQLHAGYSIPASIAPYINWKANFSAMNAGVTYLFK